MIKTVAKNDRYEKILISDDETGRAAVLTRFKYCRLWSVNGGHVGDEVFRIICRDGDQGYFLRKKAIYIGHRWVYEGIRGKKNEIKSC